MQALLSDATSMRFNILTTIDANNFKCFNNSVKIANKLSIQEIIDEEKENTRTSNDDERRRKLFHLNIAKSLMVIVIRKFYLST